MAIFLNDTEIKQMEINSNAIESVYIDGVLVARKPTITTQPVGGTITDASTQALSVVADGLGSTLTYQWYKDDEVISGATSANYTFDPSATGTYSFYCRVNGFSGYTDTSVVNVVVNSAAPTITTQPVGGTIYYPNTKTLTVVADGHGATVKYQWYKDGAAISGATAASYTFTPSTTAGNFNFFCRATTSGYVDSTTVTITVIVQTMTVTVGHFSTSSNGVSSDSYGCGVSSGGTAFGTKTGYLIINGQQDTLESISSAYVNGNEQQSAILTNNGSSNGTLHISPANHGGVTQVGFSVYNATEMTAGKSALIFYKEDVDKTFNLYWTDS